mmetsp:Transcript_13717/g.35283  ORF Transcript_13717/g.35283 Transcript_13717/m.35283 type:complete len:391 (+) Transcript_13717:70-1242(+)
MAYRTRELSVLTEIDGRGSALAALRSRIDMRGGFIKAIAATAADILSLSAQKGSQSIIALLSRGVPPSKRQRQTTLSLLEACEAGEVNELRQLLDEGSPIDQTDPEGWTPLMFACDNNHLETVQLLLERGADCNQASRLGTTALMIACAGGFTDVARILIREGAELGRQARSGWTALMEACGGGFCDTARLLLEYGADAAQSSQHGDTALMRSCMRGDLELVHWLCAYGAPRDAVDRHGNTALEAARAFATRPDPSDNQHQLIIEWLAVTWQWTTPLHHLTIIDAARAMELLAQGASVHARAPGGVEGSANGGPIDGLPPSPLDLARALEREGHAPSGSAAAVVLHWWRARLIAVAMGTHARLGMRSPLIRLACVPEVLELIVDELKATS